MNLIDTEEEYNSKKPSDLIFLLCQYCLKPFSKTKTEVHMAKKYENIILTYGKMDFCSKSCASKTPKEEIKKILENCGLKIIPQDNYIGKDPVVFYHCPCCKKKTSKRLRYFQWKLYDCEECQLDKIKEKRKELYWKYFYFLKNNGYITLTKEFDFINSGTRTPKNIKVTCPNGHETAKPTKDLAKGFLRACRSCMLKAKTGSKCNLYIDGRNTINKDERAKIGSSLKTWRRLVLSKFANKCVICNSKEKLHAHHLNGFLLDKENRLNVDNGVCLCQRCHIKFHTDHGKKNNIKSQYDEFYKNETTPLILDWSDWLPTK